MNKVLTFVLSIVTIISYGQGYKYPTLRTKGHYASDFSPKGWSVSDSVQGDLNNDGLLDKVFIIKAKNAISVKDNDGNDFQILPKILVIALKDSTDNFFIAETNSKLLLDDNGPPTHSNPFGSMAIENNILTLSFSFDYIGGNFTFYKYKFRFQKSRFQLIGAEGEYTTRNTMNFEKASYNFLTKKWSLTIGTYSKGEPPTLNEKTEWFKLNIDKLKTFKTMDTPGTWKITTDRWL